MALPFAPNDGKAKYSCFVCGVQHEAFEDFKTHIIEKHDEGREYVLCPLVRCGAPVRDVRQHFRAKHPSEPMPKVSQMKAMIWKDQSPKDGKMKARKTKFRTGYMISNKNQGKEMHYRSGTECEIYECLEMMPEVMKYDVEPFAVKYSHKGEVHEYNPDLSIVFDDGHVEIWEIKPANQTALDINTAKWTACQAHCEARGWEFIIVTEVGLNKMKNRIRNMTDN